MYICYSDGGCNNRIHADAYGSYVIYSFDWETKVQELFARKTFLLDCKTSNQAEYLSLIRLLQKIDEVDIGDFYLSFTDSRLVYNQVNGYWSGSGTENSKILLNFAKIARELKNKHKVSLEWIDGKEMKKILGH
jgi:ribonuclease HI